MTTSIIDILSYLVILLTFLGISNIFRSFTNYGNIFNFTTSLLSSLILLNYISYIFIFFGAMTIIIFMFIIYKIYKKHDDVKQNGVTVIFKWGEYMSSFPFYRVMDFIGFLLLASSIGLYWMYNKTKKDLQLRKSVVSILLFLFISYMFFLIGDYYIYNAYQSYVYQIGGIIDSLVINLPHNIKTALKLKKMPDNPILNLLSQIGLITYSGVFTFAILNIGIIQKTFVAIKNLIKK